MQERLEMGQVAGQVGMRAAGDIAQVMANHATTDAEKAAWSDGGINKVLLHGLVGAGAAALGGGNALQGAAGAMASEKASLAMQQYLDDHHITDPGQRNALMQLGSAALGGAVGGGAGAATALQGDQYNRTLHPEYAHRLDHAAETFAAEQCAAAHCISHDEARQRLIYQAYREQDATYDQTQAAQGKPNDTAAAQFLAGKASGYLDPSGQAIDLSHADEAERQNPGLFANTLYHDPQAREWVKEATGLSDDYLANMARQDNDERQIPAYADQYANWQANQTLRDMIGYATPFGGVATVGELAYRGQYGAAAKKAGKEIAINAAAAGVGKAVGAAAGAINAAIKESKAAEGVASAAEDTLKVNVLKNVAESKQAREGSSFGNLNEAEGQLQESLGIWPPNGGAYAPTYNVTLESGMKLDRYGYPGGSYLSPLGDSFGGRGLPSSYETSKPYFQYEIIRPISGVTQSRALPWFGQPGKGVQFQTPNSVQWYLDNGYLKVIKQ